MNFQINPFIVVKKIEFFYRFIVLTFYCCKNNVLSLYKYCFIVAFYRFIFVAVNLEMILTVQCTKN